MKKINHETVIQSVILILTVILIFCGLVSGKINKYVHPRFNISLWCSIIVLLLFIISIVVDKRKGRHNTGYQQYLVYLVPLIFAIAFQPIASGKAQVVLADSITSVKSANTSNNITDQNNDLNDISQTDTTASDFESTPGEASYSNSSDTSGDAGYSSVEEYLQGTQNQQDLTVTPDVQSNNNTADPFTAYKKNEVDGYYVIDDDIFADWFMDLYDHPDDFAGQKYQFLAQVFSMDGLKDNQFLAGRDFMVCCAADLIGYGLICENNTGSKFKENQWIMVSATISKCEYNGSEVPMLINAQITETNEPKVGYIYYSGY